MCGGHSTHESHDDPTGRCTDYPSSVHGVGLVAARTGTDHRTGPVPGSSGLEEGSDRPQESHGGDLASVGAPVVHPSSIESCPPVRRHGAARAGDAERLVHQGQGLGVPSLVPGSTAAGDRRSQEAAINLSGASALVGHEKPDQRGHRLEVPCDSTAGRADERSGAHDGHGHFFSQGLRQRALQQVGSSTRPCSAPAVRSAVPKGRLQALSSGATTAGARELVCALTLRNPSNFCYMNVALRGLLWTLADHLDSSELFHRTGREALKLVLQHNAKPLHIFGMPMWRMLLHNWGNPQMQHDAAEFLAFLLSKLQANTFTWGWEARIGNESDTASEVADRGNSQQAITLDLPGQEGPYDLQLLLNAWHEQAHTHALTGDATLLMFRLARYRQQEGGIVRNNCVVTWASSVCIPIFDGQGNSSVAQEFVIQAVVMHHGHTLHSGHYTLSMHASDMTFFCDDGVLPQPRPQPDTGRHHSDAAYMFLCRRLDPAGGHC